MKDQKIYQTTELKDPPQKRWKNPRLIYHVPAFRHSSFLISEFSGKFWENFINFGGKRQCVISSGFFSQKLRNVASEYQILQRISAIGPFKVYLWKFFNVFATILQHTCAYLKIYALHMNRTILCHWDGLHSIRLQLPWHFQVFFLQILITNKSISQHIQWRNFRRSSLPLESQMTFPRGPNASFYVCSVLCTLHLSIP